MALAREALSEQPVLCRRHIPQCILQRLYFYVHNLSAPPVLVSSRPEQRTQLSKTYWLPMKMMNAKNVLRLEPLVGLETLGLET